VSAYAARCDDHGTRAPCSSCAGDHRAGDHPHGARPGTCRPCRQRPSTDGLPDAPALAAHDTDLTEET
jgi:hypothetical protein